MHIGHKTRLSLYWLIAYHNMSESTIHLYYLSPSAADVFLRENGILISKCGNSSGTCLSQGHDLEHSALNGYIR